MRLAASRKHLKSRRPSAPALLLPAPTPTHSALLAMSAARAARQHCHQSPCTISRHGLRCHDHGLRSLQSFSKPWPGELVESRFVRRRGGLSECTKDRWASDSCRLHSTACLEDAPIDGDGHVATAHGRKSQNRRSPGELETAAREIPEVIVTDCLHSIYG